MDLAPLRQQVQEHVPGRPLARRFPRIAPKHAERDSLFWLEAVLRRVRMPKDLRHVIRRMAHRVLAHEAVEERASLELLFQNRLWYWDFYSLRTITRQLKDVPDIHAYIHNEKSETVCECGATHHKWIWVLRGFP